MVEIYQNADGTMKMRLDYEREGFTMNFVPFEKKIWLSSPTMHGDELRYVTEAYETNWMSTVGKNINETERLICERVGCRYAVALSCGTAALHLAVKLAGVKPGDKEFNAKVVAAMLEITVEGVTGTMTWVADGNTVKDPKVLIIHDGVAAPFEG